jgi:hypothetical protein
MERLAETLLQLIPDQVSADRGLWVDRVHVEMPIELYLRRGEEHWQLETSAPTQRIKTAVLPVFHRITLTLQVDTEEGTSD